MILISHRGNLTGPSPTEENKPYYIDFAISNGFDVEIDVRMIGSRIFLGHDGPEEEIGIDWLSSRMKNLWVHCKNLDIMSFLNGTEFNHFWHQDDDCTLTSHGFIWTYPGKTLYPKSIGVLPEKWQSSSISNCSGICSDFIKFFPKNS